MERYSISSRARISIGSASCFIFLSLYIVPLVLEGQAPKNTPDKHFSLIWGMAIKSLELPCKPRQSFGNSGA
jgi:hypothetical protein